VGPALHISSWRVYGLMDEVMVLSSKSNLVFVPITKNISTKMAVESLTPLYPSSLRVLTLYLSLFWCFVFLGKLKKCEVDVNVIPRYPSLVFVHGISFHVTPRWLSWLNHVALFSLQLVSVCHCYAWI